MSMINLSDLDLYNRRILIRQDLNVPIKDGVIMSDKRIKASLPTIKLVLKKKAKVILMSHLGRPSEGKYDPVFSLQAVANRLGELLGLNVRLEKNWLGGVSLGIGEVVLCENVRFNVGEKKNDKHLAQKMARLCEVFVMDAFGSAHRTHASTYGVAQYAPIACAGPLLLGELAALGTALDKPKRPLVAIVGGAKVSTKLMVLESLSKVVDQLIVGGGIANTFIAAQGHNVGQSLYEHDLIGTAKKLMQSCKIPVPSDVVCGKTFAQTTPAEIKTVGQLADDDMIFDIGPRTIAVLVKIIKNAGTIVWNGPVGVFEFEQFGCGTKKLSTAIAASNAFTIAGGGDTLAAVDCYNIEHKLSYISTGGGAFLEFLEGKKLPAVAILQTRSSALKTKLGE